MNSSRALLPCMRQSQNTWYTCKQFMLHALPLHMSLFSFAWRAVMYLSFTRIIDSKLAFRKLYFFVLFRTWNIRFCQTSYKWRCSLFRKPRYSAWWKIRKQILKTDIVVSQNTLLRRQIITRLLSESTVIYRRLVINSMWLVQYKHR